MPVTLCLDYGNTRLKYVIFHDHMLHAQGTVENVDAAAVSPLLDRFSPDKCILSSVVDHAPDLETLLEARTRFHKLSHLTRMPFTVPVGKPETMGADRLALAAAAVSFFPEKHNLVIGLGTAVTFNFITQDHRFLGGSISPGMEMRFRSLHEYTAKLPLVKKDWVFPLIGYDTRTNILSGVILGMAAEIDGIIDSYSIRYENFNVVLTGGDCTYFARHLKNRIFADPDFLYKGLYALSEKNN
jgi:type III pantothenate kinase